MSKNNNLSLITKGILKENPVFVLVLGTCPTLAVTNNVFGAFGMGIAAMIVLICSNMLISALRKVIPDSVRIPSYIVIIAGFVTIVQMLVQAFLPELNDMLGVYLPLIVVNCIILGRAESYASKNPVIPSFFDGLGMGLGFTLALGLLGAVREIIGPGEIFGINILPRGIEPVRVIGLGPGAFFVLACLVAIQNKIKLNSGKKVKEDAGCSGNCSSCGSLCKTDDIEKEEA